MSHHIQGSSCDLCDQKLSQGEPSLKAAFKVIKRAFPDCHISWVFRNEQEQNQCFAAGTSRLKWPKSAHNALKDGAPCARAIDLFRMTSDGQARFERAYYRGIADLLAKNATDLFWGGSWSTISDLDHFQIKLDCTGGGNAA